ncbi:hypothetical protein N9X61_00650 [Sulfurimonas sp.]|nr:hypothetical protein [Sulfurimonas sp.]
MYFLAYSLFFMFALLFFVPKVSLYHYAEKQLQKQKVIFSNEVPIDKAFSLGLQHMDVSYDSIQSAKVENVDIKLFMLYNHVHIQNIELSEMAAAFLPTKIDNIDIEYTLLNPLEIIASSSGDFGDASASLNILDRNVSVILMPSELMQKKYTKTLRNMKKNTEGSYEYAKTF